MRLFFVLLSVIVVVGCSNSSSSSTLSDSEKALLSEINGSNYKALRQHPTVAGIRVEAYPMQAIDDR